MKQEKDNNKLVRLDYIIMSVLILIYGILSFYKLGNIEVPKTYHSFNESDEVVLSLESMHEVSKIRYYTGYNIGEFSLMVSEDGENYQELTDLNTVSVFAWEDLNINTSLKYLKIVSKSMNNCLGDVQIYDENNKKLLVHSEVNSLVDELKVVPDEISYMNSAYFDEIYFARSAYEYVHGIDVFEWSHPPVGKLIMALPVLLFGFSPFTYRFMGNMAGILMIPVMYILAKKIFKDRKYAILAAVLITFDNFHMAHTRMGTVDSFLVLFVMSSALFMFDYLELKDDSLKNKSKYLILSGIFIGLAIATKWTGLYAGLGLAIVFFINLYQQYKDNIKKIFKDKDLFKKIYFILILVVIIPMVMYYSLVILEGIGVAKLYTKIYLIMLVLFFVGLFYVINKDDKYLIKLSIICIISFIMIPVVIYVMSYLLFPNVSYYDGTLKGILETTKMMYDYHAYLDATHPFSSNWYSWVVMYKPVWYYGGLYSNNSHASIVGIGNPSIWWLSLPGIIYIIYRVIKKHDNDSLFILIFILATYLPYVFIGRIMFMYHFFVTFPFIILAITSMFKGICEKIKSNDLCLFYIVLVVVMFVIFYPVTTGIVVSNEYFDSIKWISSWWF